MHVQLCRLPLAQLALSRPAATVTWLAWALSGEPIVYM